MSLQQYNKLLSNMLTEKQALASLRAQLERRQKRECWSCRKFRHLVYNCRTKKGEKKKKEKSQNRYEMLVARVMQCRVKDKVEVRQQEKVEGEVKYFRYWGVGYQKWEYPNIGVVS